MSRQFDIALLIARRNMTRCCFGKKHKLIITGGELSKWRQVQCMTCGARAKRARTETTAVRYWERMMEKPPREKARRLND